MSLVHTILVGHFDLRAFRPRDVACVQPLDMARVGPLLSQVVLPAGEEVLDEGGYLSFRWIGSPAMLALVERVAASEDYYAIEMSNYEIMRHPAGTSGEWPARRRGRA
jgi:hypothetical protein